jgi:2-dehydropantoate 2-reductase
VFGFLFPSPETYHKVIEEMPGSSNSKPEEKGKLPPQTVYVIGGGSIGAFLAGRFASSGVTTVLVVRTSERRDALAPGLRFTPATADNEGFEASPGVATWEDCPPFPANSRVYLCCKVFQLEEALFQVRARIQDDTRVIFCQNGLGIFEEAERFLFPTPRWQRAICWFGVRPAGTEPSEFIVTGKPGIELGGSRPDLLVETASELRAAGIPILFEGPASQAEWRKALWNLAGNALCTLANAPNGEMSRSPYLRPIAEAVIREAIQVGKALGVFLGPEDEIRTFRAAEAAGANYNSMLQDLRAGRPNELPWLNGTIVREGDRLGISVPVNRTLTHLVSYLSEQKQKSELKSTTSPST